MGTQLPEKPVRFRQVGSRQDGRGNFTPRWKGYIKPVEDHRLDQRQDPEAQHERPIPSMADTDNTAGVNVNVNVNR